MLVNGFVMTGAEFWIVAVLLEFTKLELSNPSLTLAEHFITSPLFKPETVKFRVCEVCPEISTSLSYHRKYLFCSVSSASLSEKVPPLQEIRSFVSGVVSFKI